MRYFSIASAAFASVMLATPALAQDGSFTGFHAEALIGWDNFSPGGGDGSRDSKDNIVYGGAVGYDFELQGGFVLGVDAELTGSDVSAEWLHPSTPTDYLYLRATRDIYVGVKAGYAFNPQWLGYAKLGYSNLNFDATYDARMPGSSPIQFDDKNDGFRAGVGLEYLFGDGPYAKVEYRYSHYGQNIRNLDVDLDRNQILVGVGYRF